MATRQKKRDDGRYQKSVLIGRNPDGSPKRKIVYAKTQQELDLKVTALKQQIITRTYIDIDMTFTHLGEIWMKQFPTRSAKWHKRKQSKIDNHLLPALGDIDIRELRMMNLQDIINNMAEEGYATSTMKKVKQTADAMMEFACDNEWLLRNHFKKVKVPEVEAPETRFLEDDEILLITKSWRGHRFGIGALIMLYCGLRLGELLALTWEDIDYESNVIHVTKARECFINRPSIKKPKTKAGIRNIPIPDILLESLKELDGKHGLICTSAGGKLMSDSAYKRTWESYFNHLNKAAGGRCASKYTARVQVVNDMTSKMLRHTYATLLYDAGVDVKSAQYFMGHEDIETTLSIYTHLSKFRKKKSVVSLNKHIVEKMKEMAA